MSQAFASREQPVYLDHILRGSSLCVAFWRVGMSDEELFDSVRSTIIDVLDLDGDIEITRATTAEDIEGWDSLQHVRILTTLERSFGFRFLDEEVEGLRNVADLVSCAV